MADNKNINSLDSLTTNLLPRIYRSDANRNFLQSTLDQLTQPGTVTKISGFIGQQTSKTTSSSDIFIKAVSDERQNYQLEPSIVINDKLANNIFFKDYQDYINQIGVFGGITTNHAKLNKQEFYSWDPHIDWDKFVNFKQYYWVPDNQPIFTIAGHQKAVTSTFSVKLESVGNSTQYVFTPNGLTPDPVITLFRGYSYTFNIDSPNNPFSIMTERSVNPKYRYNSKIVSGQGSTLGDITFVVPNNCPDILYYQSESDINLGGIFKIMSVSTNTFIDVENEILGKVNYTLTTGEQLKNGMLVNFSGSVSPEIYQSGSYFIEGVGKAIKLIDAESIKPLTSVADPEYIVMNRACRDRNYWARSNQWFHQDFVENPLLYARAARPIIEFEADLKLFNNGTDSYADIDILDSETTDVFSRIEGSVSYYIDGVELKDGDRILFLADTDSLVKNNIYKVNIVDFNHESYHGYNTGTRIHLTIVEQNQLDQIVFIKSGNIHKGETYWFNGDSWVLSQIKTSKQQPPLFEIDDKNGVSFADNSVYSGSNFKGTTLFSYKIGTGTNDSILNFPLSYKNIDNVGDIVFNFNLISDTFEYKTNNTTVTHPIHAGFLSSKTFTNTPIYVNGWQKCESKMIQAVVRIYNNQVNNFELDMFNDIEQLTDLELMVFVNGIKLNKSDWFLTDSIPYKIINLVTNIMDTDVLSVKAYTAQQKNQNGYYETPINLQNNPLNDDIGDFTLGEVTDHVRSIIDNFSRDFEGVYPGKSNIRDLGNITKFGTKFVQHSGPLSLSIYFTTDSKNNVKAAIEKSRDDYLRFKRSFIKTSETLGVHADTTDFVDLIMSRISTNKTETDPYFFSDMVPFSAGIKVDHVVKNASNKYYPLTNSFDLSSLSNRAVGVYLNSVQLLVGRDYIFTDTGYVYIKDTLVIDDIITIHEYSNTDRCCVPETPTKLGLWPKYEPSIFLDTSLLNPINVIQGHDGSKTVAYNDYRDDLILELEKRIYNNIKVKYDSSIFDIFNVIPGYCRTTDYSYEEFNQVLAPCFYKWASTINQDVAFATQYDNSNEFSFNYSGNYAPDGRPLPGYWRGVYRWLLDTDKPNLFPWEILGMSEKPEWWESVYGPAPYTSNNLVLWKDLSEGKIKEPGKPAIVTKFVRPYLLSNIPVDESGNVVSPFTSGLAHGPLTRLFDNEKLSPIFGDVGPVEAAWRSSSHYPFSAILSHCILNPAAIGVLIDRSRITRNNAGQLVHSDTNLRIRPADIKLLSFDVNNRIATAGLINYVINNIISSNKYLYNLLAYDLSNITTQLSYRIGGFSSKEKFNLLLNSKNPTAYGNIYIPAEDYDIILNTSSPLKKITYSGVIITKVQDGYEVKGYSLTTPYFYYYQWIDSGRKITIGGISEPYTDWTVGQQYASGKIVKYNNKFYRVLSLITASEPFDTKYYNVLLDGLPIIGGRTATLRKQWDRTIPKTIPYGHLFSNAQDVVDFLLGYGEFLKDQGFSFDNFNTPLAQVSNWFTSVDEFLFWTTQQWSLSQNNWVQWKPNIKILYDVVVKYAGEYYRSIIEHDTGVVFNNELYIKLPGLSVVGRPVISLSPSATGVFLSTPYAVIDDIGNPRNSYEIVNVSGQTILTEDLKIHRDKNTTSCYALSEDGIYGASFYIIQSEHVVLIKNTTRFNDVIFNPPSGYRQLTLKVSGYVTTTWDGSFNAPGFIFDQAKIKSWETWHDYSSSDIVTYQNIFYSANKSISASAEFNAAEWTIMENKPYSKLMPNWTYKATQFSDFYSLDSGNFDINQQHVAQHLIGYQKRDYLSNIIQDDVSEFKFFQGMIADKGSIQVLSKLFDVLSADDRESVTFYEEWAIRVGQYGANSSFENIEFIIDESVFTDNPHSIELVSSSNVENINFVTRIAPDEIYVKPVNFTPNIWPTLKTDTALLRKAGDVKSGDARITLGRLSEIETYNINSLNDGDYVHETFWNNSWNIYRFTNMKLRVTDITLDLTTSIITVTVNNQHMVPAGDYIGILNSTEIDGFHRIIQRTPTTFEISTTLVKIPVFSLDSIVLFSFNTQRLNSIDDVNTTNLKTNELVWVNDSNTWKNQSIYYSLLDYYPYHSEHMFGKVIAVNEKNNVMVAASSESILIYAGSTNHKNLFQTLPLLYANYMEIPSDVSIQKDISLDINDEWLFVGMPYVTKKLIVTDFNTIQFIEPFYVGTAKNHGAVSIYKVVENNQYELYGTIVSPHVRDDANFGASVKVISNNNVLIGQPGTNEVYVLEYVQTTVVIVGYNPEGSDGFKVKLTAASADLLLISPEMFVTITNGDGSLYKIKDVYASDSYIVLYTKLNIDLESELSIVQYNWAYSLSKTLRGGSLETSRFGTNIIKSLDNSTVAFYTPAVTSSEVIIYSVNNLNFENIGTISGNNQLFGYGLALSKTGEYLAVSDSAGNDEYNNGYIDVYNRSSDNVYKAYQRISNNHSELLIYFGNKLSFMDDYGTLVVYSKYADSYQNTTFDLKMTTFDNMSSVFNEGYIDSSRVDLYERHDKKWIYGEHIPNYSPLSDKYGDGFAVSSNTIYIGSPTSGYGKIHEFKKDSGASSWTILRSQIDKPDVSKIKRAFLYNKKTNTVVANLDILDPLNGKFLSIAEKEIDFKVFYDPALYTIGDANVVNVDSDVAWTDSYVGKVWWDLRTAKFINSYDSDIVYRNNSWNKLATGASIDIYEWVESSLLPSEWDLLADTTTGISEGISGKSIYGDVSYSKKNFYDNISGSIIPTYYFWVKNKQIVPTNSGRKLSCAVISNLIGDPTNQGYQYLALTGTNSFSLSNINGLLETNNIVLSIDYWITEKTDQNIHTVWKVISNSENTKLPENIENKWFDSLCGIDLNNDSVPDISLPVKLLYGIENRPRQSMFVNRINALSEFINKTNEILMKYPIATYKNLNTLKQVDSSPDSILGLYDVVVETENDLSYINTYSFVQASVEPIINDGRIIGINIINPGYGYKFAPEISVDGDGIGASFKIVLGVNGDISDILINYSGIGYTSNTTLNIRPLSALVQSDSTINNKWGIYCYINNVWTRKVSMTYNTVDFWSYVDWYQAGYSSYSEIKYTIFNISALLSLTTEMYDLVKIQYSNTGDWIIVEKYNNVETTDWTVAYRIIGSQNGTIQLNKSIYDFKNTLYGFENSLYDNDSLDKYATIELRNILNALKNDILIDDLKQEYLNLFFSSIHYILNEQLYVDWIFKTSFVNAKHNIGLLRQKSVYKNDNLANFEDYIAEVKPYRTTIREYVSSYSELEISKSSVTDFDLVPFYDNGHSAIIETQINDGLLFYDNSRVLTPPWSAWSDNIGFKIKNVALVDNGIGYASQPEIFFIGPCTKQATASAEIVNGIITKINIIDGGSGYLSIPKVVISGGLTVSGKPAKGIAILGDCSIRSNTIGMKFDRITYGYCLSNIQQTETFFGDSSRTSFPLIWKPDNTKGNSTVTVDGRILLSYEYTLDSDLNEIIFNNPINDNIPIIVTYRKDITVFNAVDRINFFYDPQIGDLGNDPSQLMEGIDYGGVIVSGLGFDVDTGWDSLPYYSDKWDSVDLSQNDFITPAIIGTYTYTLPYVPASGVQMNIYYKNGSTTIRIDSATYPTAPIPTGVIMASWIGDGIHNTIQIPNTLTIVADSEFIFRQSTSDGSVAIHDYSYDAAISGGNLSYSTATGVSADDINIDGDGFSTVNTSNAPEEVVPGHIVDAVAIKVFEKPPLGNADIKIMNYRGDGITTAFDIGQKPNNINAVMVKVETFSRDENGNLTSESVIKTMLGISDYTVDYINELINFTTPPDDGSLISIFSIGLGGTATAYVEIEVDGLTKEFQTQVQVTPIFSILVFINGVPTFPIVTSDTGVATIIFDNPPASGSILSYIINNGPYPTVAITKTERIKVDGRGANVPYVLVNNIGNSIPTESNMIVRVDNKILLGPENNYFSITNDQLIYYPSFQFNVDVKVIAKDIILVNDIDYVVDTLFNSITITQAVYDLYVNNILIISNPINEEFEYIPALPNQAASITFKNVYNYPQIVEVTTSYTHDSLGIQNTVLTADIPSYYASTVDYYQQLGVSGGIITLTRIIDNENFVWVTKNGKLLTKIVDYVLNEDRKSITLAVLPRKRDKFMVMTYNNVKEKHKDTISYMQFKDMLNRTHFKRLSTIKQSVLLKDLLWDDTEIELNGALNFTLPDPQKNIPGIVDIRGERIEYFSIIGNVLSKLRRSTLGTGAPLVHPKGTYVQDIGASETIPYEEIMDIEKIVPLQSDSHTMIETKLKPIINAETWVYDNGFVSNPLSRYGYQNAIEVFVGGYSESVWEPNSMILEGTLIRYGVITYKVLTTFLSGQRFENNVMIQDSEFLFTISVPSYTVISYFIGNIRLKNAKYYAHSITNAPTSPEGDILYPPDYTLTGDNYNVINLNRPIDENIRLTVAKRSGVLWGDISLWDDTSESAKFIRTYPGINNIVLKQAIV